MRFAAQAFVRRHVRNRREEFNCQASDGFIHQASSVASSPQLTGFLPQTGQHAAAAGSERPLSTAWIPDELIAETRRVWSSEYGRVISEAEALEILSNVKRLAGTLLRAAEESDD